MRGADGDGEGIAAGSGYEFLDLFGTGIGGVFGGYLDFILNAGERAELRFNDHAVVVRIGDDLPGQGDILFKRLGGGVDHDGGEAAVNAAFAQLKAVAVVEVNADGEVKTGVLLRIFDCRFDQLHEIDMIGVLARALGDLQDERCALLDGGVADALDDLHVVDIERADGIPAVIGFLKHFL